MGDNRNIMKIKTRKLSMAQKVILALGAVVLVLIFAIVAVMYMNVQDSLIEMVLHRQDLLPSLHRRE